MRLSQFALGVAVAGAVAPLLRPHMPRTEFIFHS